MSENATPINDGKVNVAGVDINIKQVLGDMIAQQVTSSFTEEQMQKGHQRFRTQDGCQIF